MTNEQITKLNKLKTDLQVLVDEFLKTEICIQQELKFEIYNGINSALIILDLKIKEAQS